MTECVSKGCGFWLPNSRIILDLPEHGGTRPAEWDFKVNVEAFSALRLVSEQVSCY